MDSSSPKTSTSRPRTQDRKPSARTLARQWALMYLFQHDITQEPPCEHDLAEFWEQIKNGPATPSESTMRTGSAFALELINACLAKRSSIDETISRLAENWTLERMATVDRNILRLAACELAHWPATPAPVIVYEAIELAHTFGDSDSYKFVNGILHRLALELRGPDAMAGRPS